MLKRRSAQLAEGILAGRYRDGEVAMLPDGSLSWERHQLPPNLGTLLLAPGCDRAVVIHLARRAFGPNRLPGNTKRGGYSTVRLTGDLAIKSFNIRDRENHYGLEPLRVNVALAEGLKRINNVIGDWKIVAPRQWGALFPVDPEEPGVWVMSREEGKHGLPRFGRTDVRERLYHAAIAACGTPHARVVVDEKPTNALVRPGTDTKFELVKFDLFVTSTTTQQSGIVGETPLGFVAA